MGKSRLFRATLRLTDTATYLLASFAALVAGLADLAGAAADRLVRLLLRREALG